MHPEKLRASLDAVCFWGLVAIVTLSPLPLGSARPWAWGVAGLGLALLLVLAAVRAALPDSDAEPGRFSACLPAAILGGGALCWAAFQASPWAPLDWQHPLWSQLPALLGQPAPGSISLDPGASCTAIFRLLDYAAVFILAAQLCRERSRAYAGIHAVTLAGIAYALYGLIAFSAGNGHILWLEKWAYPDDLTATFVNRNSLATYLGIALLSLTALLVDGARRQIDPRRSGKARMRALIELATGSRWWVFAGLPAVGAALLLTHSRGGFVATGAGLAALGLALVLAPGFRVPWRMRGTLAVVALIGLGLTAYGGRTVGRIVETSIGTEARTEIDASLLRAIVDFRWTGTGLGTFRYVFPAYSPPGFDEPLDLAHNDYLENALELGIPAAIAFYAAAAWIVGLILAGVLRNRHRAVFPCLGLAVAALVAVHALFDFSMQIPAVAFDAAFILGVAVANLEPRRSKQ